MAGLGQTWSSQPYLDHVSAPAQLDAFDLARQHTQCVPCLALAVSPLSRFYFSRQPIVTGTSILGVRFSGGVMLASDTLASYGSLARFMDVRRLREVEESNAIIGASGDMADFQYLMHQIDKVG
jgi:20S proteasome subunit beta 7